ncbi:hypothetical protein [Mycobacterium shigaense]|uniref:hypothetical protein n=1 Tax=Mycobacterium shigaense TaxID=722731 RepID=UPI002AE00525|nr:hypothetical protein [Mycobacterium shigaense]MEA1124082.1 hypothetical protein [Mycobacterium shigaense]
MAQQQRSVRQRQGLERVAGDSSEGARPPQRDAQQAGQHGRRVVTIGRDALRDALPDHDADRGPQCGE